MLKKGVAFELAQNRVDEEDQLRYVSLDHTKLEVFKISF